MSEFKIGDKVRVIHSTFEDDKRGFGIGTICYLAQNSEQTNYPHVTKEPVKDFFKEVDQDNIKTWSCFHISDLKLIEENKQEENYNMDNLLTFDQLEEGICYRLLHGGEKDHGYDYILKDGVLFNQKKGKNSSVPFNTKTRFIETENKFLKLSSLDYEVEFHSRGAKIGCQQVSIEDLKEIAAQILVRYE